MFDCVAFNKDQEKIEENCKKKQKHLEINTHLMERRMMTNEENEKSGQKADNAEKVGPG